MVVPVSLYALWELVLSVWLRVLLELVDQIVVSAWIPERSF